MDQYPNLETGNLQHFDNTRDLPNPETGPNRNISQSHDWPLQSQPTFAHMLSLFSRVVHLGDMYSPTTVRDIALDRRALVFARGPGWTLGEGDAGSWTLRIDRECGDPQDVWTDILRALRSIAEAHRLGPVLVDLRRAPRLASPTAELAAEVFAEFERRSVRVAAVVGPDLVHAARMHRLLGMHAPLLGRCCLTEHEGLDWVARGMWPVASAPVLARPWTRSRPFVVAAAAATATAAAAAQ